MFKQRTVAMDPAITATVRKSRTLINENLAKELEIDQTGYRVIMNCNRDAGQIVFHLHMHLMGGRKLRE